MFSVSAMAAQAKQPNGGYLPVSLFRTLEYDDGNTTPSISAEYAGAVGTVVDYMTRFAMTGDKQAAFSISLAQKKLMEQMLSDCLTKLRVSMSSLCARHSSLSNTMSPFGKARQRLSQQKQKLRPKKCYWQLLL